MDVARTFATHSPATPYVSHEVFEMNGERCLEITYRAISGKEHSVICRPVVAGADLYAVMTTARVVSENPN